MMSSAEVAAPAGEAAARSQTGFYCSTSGTYFNDKESLAAHYKSDFHRYNLKRKVAGLPPVTKEWFEARKAHLSTTAAATPAAQKVGAGKPHQWAGLLLRGDARLSPNAPPLRSSSFTH